jgi:hypothetical protein
VGGDPSQRVPVSKQPVAASTPRVSTEARRRVRSEVRIDVVASERALIPWVVISMWRRLPQSRAAIMRRPRAPCGSGRLAFAGWAALTADGVIEAAQ